MKKNISTQKLCAGALLIALGVLLPQVFHLIGGQAAGGLLLPMHLPVLIGGLLLGPYYGAAVGVITPLISFLLTGMPPAARLPFMLVELVAYGIISGAFRNRFHLYGSLILAQVGGRMAYALALWVGVLIFGTEISPLAAVGAAVLTGLPGIIIQWVCVPPLVILLRRVIHFDGADKKSEAAA